MKSAFLNSSIRFIKSYKDVDDKDVEKLRYGLEGIYLTLQKMIVIVIVSLILGILKEDYEYIVRKSKTIADIMLENKSKNEIYRKIADLYNQFKHAKNVSIKKKIVLELGNLLKIDGIKLEKM